MKTVFAKISYYGPSFSGFARQPETLTVQGSIEQALQILFKREILTTCAGRTDAGVHANGNYVTFEIEDVESTLTNFSPRRLQESVDALTHDDVHIKWVKVLDKQFSARFDAKARHYSYFICNQKTPSVIMKNSSWHIVKKLDITKMQSAANYLIGEHDFKSFCVAKSSQKLDSTCRNVSEISISSNNHYGDNIIEIKVTGNAFLHSMVRTIVGSLVIVGKGQRDPSWINDVLYAKDRKLAGENAPAKGLHLMDVDY